MNKTQDTQEITYGDAIGYIQGQLGRIVEVRREPTEGQKFLMSRTMEEVQRNLELAALSITNA